MIFTVTIEGNPMTLDVKDIDSLIQALGVPSDPGTGEGVPGAAPASLVMGVDCAKEEEPKDTPPYLSKDLKVRSTWNYLRFLRKKGKAPVS